MKHYLFVLLFTYAGSFNCCLCQTTVASGNWSSPVTWGGVPPIGTGTVVINHTVTLDTDYSHTSGSITINASGVLKGSTTTRAFALNYPSGSALLTVNGSFDVARVLFKSHTVTNTGTIKADSLLNYAAITNNNSSTINAAQFWNCTGGDLNNNGTITSVNFLNTDSVSNNSSLMCTNFHNAKSFINSSTGNLLANNNWANSDTIVSPAVFINNGSVMVLNNWYNGKQIDGTGKFCVSDSSWNTGTMTGTFDFCDLTGTGSVDLNTGTIAATITKCLFPCSNSVDEISVFSVISIFPNPFTSSAVVETTINLKDALLTIYDITGKEVYSRSNINGNQFTVSNDGLSSGLFFLTIKNQQSFVAKKIIVY